MLCAFDNTGLTIYHEQPTATTSCKDHLPYDIVGNLGIQRDVLKKLHGETTRGRRRKQVGPPRGLSDIEENVETSKEIASGKIVLARNSFIFIDSQEIRSSTKHPSSNFISYNFLSPFYRVFILSIFSRTILQN